MRLFLAIILTAALLFISGIAGYALVWQGHKMAQNALRNAETQCGQIKPLLNDLMKNKHLGFLSTSIDDKGQVYMYFVSNQTGNWMILNVMPGAKSACVFLQGTDWQFILPPKLRIKEAPESRH